MSSYDLDAQSRVGHGRRSPGALPAGADVIVGAVIEAICARRLPPGAKLGENELASVFAVSRTIVRNALHHLSFMGIVRSTTNRGACIAQFSPKEASDLFAARRLIEGETVVQLARHCTANDIRRLREHVARERAKSASGHTLDLIQLRGDFHLLLARLAGNEVLADMMEALVARTALIRAFY